jgi:hypothetical protein
MGTLYPNELGDVNEFVRIYSRSALRDAGLLIRGLKKLTLFILYLGGNLSCLLIANTLSHITLELL